MIYDTVVVGAGPAGSTAAKFLSEKGFRVLILDKKKFPRNKCCGGGIPLRVMRRFPYIKNEGLFESYSYGGRVYSSNLEDFTELYKNKPIVAMVLREKFDNGLLKLAENSGAIVKDGKKVVDIKILEDKAKIILEDGSFFESQIIIGADGVCSNIAKKSGLIQGHRDIGICVLNECPMNMSTLDKFFDEGRFCHIFLRFQGIAGYGWIFPKKEHVNIGISEYRPTNSKFIGTKNLKEVFFNFIKTLKENKILPPNLEVGNIHGGTVPICLLNQTYSNRVVLCGDAGGFINPISGEGIYYAMTSGEIAAKAIAIALESGKTNEKSLSIYQKMWKNDFGKDIKLLSNYTENWTVDTNRFIKYTKSDEKLADMALGIFQGDLSPYDYRWKLITRTLYVYFRELIKQKI
jgi:geranylgeranyl reductase family protein